MIVLKWNDCSEGKKKWLCGLLSNKKARDLFMENKLGKEAAKISWVRGPHPLVDIGDVYSVILELGEKVLVISGYTKR